MITVEIPKKDLLKQLPEKAGYALMQWLDQMPDKFVFQALQIQSREEEVQAAYPELIPLLSPKETQVLMAFYKRGWVNRFTLACAMGAIDEGGLVMQTSNVVDVHVKNLRKKLREHTTLRILTRKAGWGRDGAYRLKDISDIKKHGTVQIDAGGRQEVISDGARPSGSVGDFSEPSRLAV